MDYIIFDLELNQEHNVKKRNKNVEALKCPFEIIQLGAVRLDENFNTVSTFNRLIKPEIYSELNPYVEEMTGITQEKLETAAYFAEVYEEFSHFAEGDKNILCVWGTGDMKELFRNIHYHNLDNLRIPKEYINIQCHASKHFNCAKGTNIGLGNAVELLGIPAEKQFHDAFHDAYYTAEVFRIIYNKDMKPKKYHLDSLTPHLKASDSKKKINTDKLMKQFEKMFGREMTKEEQSIIKLAYIMGKTNQFDFIESDSED